MYWVRVSGGLFALLLSLLTTGCLKHELQSGLTEQEAQEIVIVLNENGLAADSVREVGGKDKGPPLFTVNIKGGDQNLVQAWRVLKENGLPRQKDKGLEEVFANAGMIPTAGEEKARLLVGLSGEISKTLKSVNGVVDARVQVVLPENSPLLDKSQWSLTTASVLLKYQGSEPPLKEDEVKKLVAKGVEGLQPDNVGVVYKKIDPKRIADPGPIPTYLGNQEFLVISLVLLVISSLGCLGLVTRNRMLRSKIGNLQRQVQAASQQAQLSAEGAGRN